MYIVLLGPPGAGKGTQAQMITAKLQLPHISSGDIFRENLKNQTALGKKAQEFIQQGELVPDDLTIAMIRERLERADCANGALLDGFPRTPAQAESLDRMLDDWRTKVDTVIYIGVPADVLVARLSGRFTCRVCGRVYHEKYNPPQKVGICDADGSELYQREDDRSETVKRRIEVYFEQTAPLIEYYRRCSLLVEIDGTKTIETVTEDLKEIVEKVKMTCLGTGKLI